ncbi:hypothetical protein GCM10023205_13980 [Yinghuangia aomiensis]|uniref:Uncharacterized protein n=1 Tax=Yinghuangia aomiensis TaxID=676205 RepID=A0ABP9GY21_9ACTN
MITAIEKARVTAWPKLLIGELHGGWPRPAPDARPGVPGLGQGTPFRRPGGNRKPKTRDPPAETAGGTPADAGPAERTRPTYPTNRA